MRIGKPDAYRFEGMEILNGNLGKSEILVHAKVRKYCENNLTIGIHVSLCHTKDLAKAIAILEITQSC